MLQKLLKNCIKSLIGIGLDLTHRLNLVFVVFYQIISAKLFFYNASYSVQILEKLDGNGRTARNALDASIISRKKQRDKTWMLKLRAVLVYGLYDRLGNEYKKEDTHVITDNKFPPLSRQ